MVFPLGLLGFGSFTVAIATFRPREVAAKAPSLAVNDPGARETWQASPGDFGMADREPVPEVCFSAPRAPSGVKWIPGMMVAISRVLAVAHVAA
jgi:hypothetical protein